MKDDLFSLKGKNIIITGASGLLGYQHAEAIVEAEGNPILLDINKPKIKEQLNYFEKNFSKKLLGFDVDITNEQQVKNCLKAIMKKVDHIDALVNNAANNPKVEGNSKTNFTRVEEFPMETWQQDLDVSLKGAMLCIKYFGTQISKNSSGGTILNVSSDLGIISPYQRLYQIDGVDNSAQPVKPITYSVVKSALIGITKYMSTYWADKNVTCNAICPGGVENGQDPSFLKNISRLIPLERLAKKDEYKGLLVFLLSSAASYINGSVIVADGGRTSW